MNANEAPQKLYFGECDKVILDIYSNRESNDEIEYTRTDAFIEKACEWLKDCLDNGMWIANDVGCAEKDVIIEHFQKYMKGEKV